MRLTFLGIHGLLLISTLSSNAYGDQNCATTFAEASLQLFDPAYKGPESGASGVVCFVKESTSRWTINVKLHGLAANTSYWLSLHCLLGAWECDTLGAIRDFDWPPGRYHTAKLGNKEGYWDFKKIKTDAQGNCAEVFKLPLEPARYSVKFFVKKDYPSGNTSYIDDQIILHNNFITFEIRKPWLNPFSSLPVICFLLLVVILFCLDWFWTPIKIYMVGNRSRQEVPQDEPVPPPAISEGGAEGDVTVGQNGNSAFEPSADYREVRLRGQPFLLTPYQAVVIRILHEAFLDERPLLSFDAIVLKLQEKIQGANPQSMSAIFRNYEDTMAALITSPPKPRGLYRINL